MNLDSNSLGVLRENLLCRDRVILDAKPKPIFGTWTLLVNELSRAPTHFASDLVDIMFLLINEQELQKYADRYNHDHNTKIMLNRSSNRARHLLPTSIPENALAMKFCTL